MPQNGAERTCMSLSDALERLPLVDHHCHGVLPGALNRATFEDLITEGFEPAPAGTSHFDSPLGLAIRRWCAPALGLDPMSSPQAYLERRSELGAKEVNRLLLRGAGVEDILVDTGYRAGDVLGPEELGRLAAAKAYEIVRLEAVAEAVARNGVDPSEYAEAFGRALEEATVGAVGLKTIVAYRGGFAFDPAQPGKDEVVWAADRWLRACEGREPRLDDPVLLRHGIWAGARLGAEQGLPLQFHAGYGDPDLTLHLTNPSLLTELIRSLGELGVTVVFLHCYPYHREAGYLAQVFPHVCFDVGLTINYTGPAAARVLAEAMELAPFGKLLYSSDAFGLAELHHLGAVLFRRALGEVLDDWVSRDECSVEEAERIAELVGRANARRIYRLAEG